MVHCLKSWPTMRSATPAWLVEQDRPRVGYAVLLFERNGMEMAQKWIDE